MTNSTETSTRRKAPTTNIERIAEVVTTRFIERDTPLTVADIAEACGVSAAVVRRVIKDASGFVPGCTVCDHYIPATVGSYVGAPSYDRRVDAYRPTIETLTAIIRAS